MTNTGASPDSYSSPLATSDSDPTKADNPFQQLFGHHLIGYRSFYYESGVDELTESHISICSPLIE